MALPADRRVQGGSSHRGSRRGDPGAWRTARGASLVLLGATLPMLPMQRAEAFVFFGSLISALAAIHWVTLTLRRRALQEPEQ